MNSFSLKEAAGRRRVSESRITQLANSNKSFPVIMFIFKSSIGDIACTDLDATNKTEVTAKRSKKLFLFLTEIFKEF